MSAVDNTASRPHLFLSCLWPVFPVMLLDYFVCPREQQTNAVVLDTPLATLSTAISAKDILQSACDFF